MEKLVEEVVKDGQHLRHLIGICEGDHNSMLIIHYKVSYFSSFTSKMHIFIRFHTSIHINVHSAYLFCIMTDQSIGRAVHFSMFSVFIK